MAFNIVEFIQDEGSDCAFDQPCKYGHRVESHAVYCHNDSWRESPRKCRRNRVDYKHEDCAGFSANSEHEGQLTSSIKGEPCDNCWGVRTLVHQGGRITCPICDGLGVKPCPQTLTRVEANMLELAAMPWDTEIVIPVVTKEDRVAINSLLERDLYSVKSVTIVGDHSAYLCHPTGRGRAAIQFYWKSQKESKT